MAQIIQQQPGMGLMELLQLGTSIGSLAAGNPAGLVGLAGVMGGNNQTQPGYASPGTPVSTGLPQMPAQITPDYYDWINKNRTTR